MQVRESACTCPASGRCRVCGDMPQCSAKALMPGKKILFHASNICRRETIIRVEVVTARR